MRRMLRRHTVFCQFPPETPLAEHPPHRDQDRPHFDRETDWEHDEVERG